jgi:hypothetical protein
LIISLAMGPQYRDLPARIEWTNKPTMFLSKNIAYSTMMLAGVAGFCDTVTFVAADELFSAHVTGNFTIRNKRSGFQFAVCSSS